MNMLFVDIWASLFPSMALQSIILSAAVLTLAYPLRKSHLRTVKWLFAAVMARMLFPPFSAPLNVAETGALSFHSTTERVIGAISSAHPITTESLFNPWLLSAVFYFSVVFLLSAFTLASHWKIRQRIRSGHIIDCSGIPVIQTHYNHSPFVFGIFKPVIVVPENWNTLSKKQQAVIIKHEQAHIQSLDPLIYLISTTACIGFFFNPLVWIIRNQLMLAQECLCDQTSGSGLDKSGLAHTLVEIAEKISFNEKAGTLAFSETYRRLTHRIHFIYEKKEAQSMFSRIIKPAFIITGMVFILAMMSVKPVTGMASDKAGSVKEDVPIKLDENKDVIPPSIIGGRKELAQKVKYPEELKKEKISGFVVLQYTVTKEGTVKEINVEGTSDERFNEAAIAAAKGVLYNPATLKGKPVSCIMTLTLQFKLDKDLKKEEPQKQ